MNRRIHISENQLALPFGQAGSKVNSYESRERLFWLFASVSVVSIFMYVYAINAAAHHIAVRQNLEKEVSSMNTDLSTLEFKAIELKNAVTIETAQEFGFSEVRQPLYVSRSSSGNSLTLNTVR